MPTPTAQALLDRRFAALDHELGLDDEPIDRHCDVPRPGLSSDQVEADRAGMSTTGAR
jgi:hypothetical protein